MVVGSIFCVCPMVYCTLLSSSTLGVTERDDLHVELYRVSINVSIRCHKYLQKLITLC